VLYDSITGTLELYDVSECGAVIGPAKLKLAGCFDGRSAEESEVADRVLVTVNCDRGGC
jgi:hypothetical protein